MVTIRGTGEGNTNSTAVSVANSGSSISHIINNGGTSVPAGNTVMTWLTAAALQGAIGIRTVPGNSAGSGANYARKQQTLTALRQTVWVKFKHPGLPSSDVPVAALFVAGSSKVAANLRSDGKIRVNGLSASDSPALTVGNVYFVEVGFIKESGGGANGSWVIQILNANGTTFHTWSLGSQTTGTSDATDARWMSVTSAQSITSVDWDDWGMQDDATWGGMASNVAPTVDAGANQNVSAASTVNLSATASDSDGSIAAYAWSFTYPTSGAPTLTGGTTATPSFTSGSAGSLYILTCQVTDDGGATTSDTVEIRVPVSGATDSRPLVGNGSGTGTWTIGGGSATDGAALADASDATYVESPTITGSAVTRRVRWTPSNARSAAVIKNRLWTDTGTAQCVVRLFEGATQRQAWSAVTLTTTPTEYTSTLDAGTISAISDWGNLFVEVSVTT